MKYFLVKLKYPKLNQNGIIKQVNECYVVSDTTFCSVEAVILETLKEHNSVEIKSIATCNYSDVFNCEDNRNDENNWFMCAIAFKDDGLNGKLIITNEYILVNEYDFDTARTSLVKNLSDCVSDYSILSIKRTNIVAVIAR